MILEFPLQVYTDIYYRMNFMLSPGKMVLNKKIQSAEELVKEIKRKC